MRNNEGQIVIYQWGQQLIKSCYESVGSGSAVVKSNTITPAVIKHRDVARVGIDHDCLTLSNLLR